MKYVTYYCNIYKQTPIWINESIKNIEHYYHRHGIDTKCISEKNKDVIKYIDAYGGIDWWSILASKTLCIKDFIESDYDIMIATDLDYVTLRPDIDIKQYLNIDLLIPHMSQTSNDTKLWGHNKLMFYEDILKEDAYNKFLNSTKQYIQCCSDFFAMSKDTCLRLVEMFKSAGWNLLDPASYAKKYLEVLEKNRDRMFIHFGKIKGVDMPEVILGSFSQYVKDNNSIKIEVNNNNKISSTTFVSNYSIDLKTLCSSECIFHHFGTISKQEPEEFLRLLKLFKRG